MSYSIDLLIDTGGAEPHYLDIGWSYTRNCSPMWRAAGAEGGAR